LKNNAIRTIQCGYSISRINGEVVTNDLETNDGEIMGTLLYDRMVTSTIKKITINTLQSQLHLSQY